MGGKVYRARPAPPTAHGPRGLEVDPPVHPTQAIRARALGVPDKRNEPDTSRAADEVRHASNPSGGPQHATDDRRPVRRGQGINRTTRVQRDDGIGGRTGADKACGVLALQVGEVTGEEKEPLRAEAANPHAEADPRMAVRSGRVGPQLDAGGEEPTVPVKLGASGHDDHARSDLPRHSDHSQERGDPIDRLSELVGPRHLLSETGPAPPREDQGGQEVRARFRPPASCRRTSPTSPGPRHTVVPAGAERRAAERTAIGGF